MDQTQTSRVVYKGGLLNVADHVKSVNNIIADAPIDNNSKEGIFFPINLVVTALASFILIIMGIWRPQLEPVSWHFHCTTPRSRSTRWSY